MFCNPVVATPKEELPVTENASVIGSNGEQLTLANPDTCTKSCECDKTCNGCCGVTKEEDEVV
jgi:hypothetical protein